MTSGDWTGEMAREQLRDLLPICGCGEPEAAAGKLLALLRAHPLYERSEEERDALLPGDGTLYLVLGVLDEMGLTEHGGIISGGWLTEKGIAMRDALVREESDGFAELFG